MSFTEPLYGASCLPSMKDPDIGRLLADNRSLQAELTQCQADKDFVWSLWKRLQVSNPDVTEAISLVIQREKEKSENKDRKVLEIIQVKDDRIEELQNIIAKQSQDVNDILSKKVETTEKSSRLQTDNDRLQERVARLESQLRSEANKERSLEDTFRKTVEGSEREKYDLNRKVSQLMTDLEVAKTEKEHALSRQKLLEERTRSLEQEVSHKMVKFEELVREVEDSTIRLSKYESQTAQQRRDLEFKNQELENIRKELKDLWMAHNQLTEHSGQQADLIRQLQSLQQDTQKMMKNQEDAFTLESTSLQQLFTDVNAKYEAAKCTEADLRQQVLELKKSMMDKDDIISSLQSQIPDVSMPHQSAYKDMSHPEYSGSLLDIVKEVDSLDKPETRKHKTRGRSLTRLSGERKPPPAPEMTRSRSLSPMHRSVSDQGMDSEEDRKLEDVERALHFKTRQVEELRRAHDNRLQRMNSLQASYKLARQEIRNLEGSSKNKGRKAKRANPRSLQKENSDQVWNELAFFKAENRSLQVERMEFQDEIDLFRVQTSQDAATIHELKVSNRSLQEEHEFQIRKLKRDAIDTRDTESQLNILKKQVQSKTVHTEKLERDMMNAMSQRDDLVQEKSKLMTQLVSTQQEASKHRMELADAKHELQNLRHALEEKKAEECTQENEEGDADVVSTVASRLMAKQEKLNKNKKDSLTKKYQKALNTSIEKMADMFDGFNEEGWEEITDNESDLESETPSLGDSIAQHSRVQEDKKARLNRSIDVKKRKLRRVPPKAAISRPCRQKTTEKNSTPTKKSPTKDHVHLREFATSPISFLSPTLSTQIEQPSTVRPSNTIRKPSAQRNSVESRQMASLKNRILYLQQQVSLLKKFKFGAIKSEEEMKDTVAKLQAELTSTSSRLKTAKQQISRLQGDLEMVQKEREELGMGDGMAALKALDRKTGDSQEIKVLEAKLKVANSEASRHAAALKNLKTENEGLQEQIRNNQDRMNHLERDVNQKRNLLESQRIKLKHAQDLNKNDASAVEELQTKFKLLTDTNNKLKVQVDSLKKRISVVLKEKKEYEEKFLKVSLELDHKTKLLNDASARKADLQSAISELEVSAQHQLRGLASQSEAAIDAAKERLAASQARIGQFQSLIKILGSELIKRAERARLKMREAKTIQERSQREGDLSLQRAQNKARDILNLSHSDLEDIMSADGDGESLDSFVGDDKKTDKRWLRKCEKLMTNKDDFVHPVITMLLQKVDERVDLVLSTPRSS